MWVLGSRRGEAYLLAALIVAAVLRVWGLPGTGVVFHDDLRVYAGV